GNDNPKNFVNLWLRRKRAKLQTAGFTRRDGPLGCPSPLERCAYRTSQLSLPGNVTTLRFCFANNRGCRPLARLVCGVIISDVEVPHASCSSCFISDPRVAWNSFSCLGPDLLSETVCNLRSHPADNDSVDAG